MTNSAKTPLLVMTYNRPRTTEIQLNRIEGLENREVFISIDGPKNSQDAEKCKEVKTLVERWASNSNHIVNVKVNQTNLGLHMHFMSAFESFFSVNEFGLVLEDDIEFRKSYVEFVDRLGISGEYKKFWSIQGHNPLSQADASFETEIKVEFTRTNFHSVWGWASHAGSIERMLKFISDSASPSIIQLAIERGSRSFTSDPVLRLAIKSVWLNKLNRSRTLHSGGWDNWWVAAAWFHQIPSMMPNVSVSRETLIQNEGQSHAHAKSGSVWLNSTVETLSVNSNRSNSKCRNEIKLLQTWGINRAYGWSYLPRVYKQYVTSLQILNASGQNAL